jgi:hypothetical protein
MQRVDSWQGDSAVLRVNRRKIKIGKSELLYLDGAQRQSHVALSRPI